MVVHRQPRISVVIPVKNAARTIERCLEAVFNQSLKPHEVIIVDGHSTDGTVQQAGRYPVKVFYQDYGAAGAARQIGLEHAEGEYLAFTDGDCIPDRDWLRHLQAGLGEGTVGAGGRIENIGAGLWTRSINLAFNTFLGSGRSIQGRTFASQKYVRSVSGCNSMYRKSDLIRAGGFNPDLSGADETELNARLLKYGKLLYVQDAAVLHDHKRGLREFARNMYHYGGWRKECGVWDLPVIPALAAPFLLLTLIASRWVLPALFAAYLVLTGAFGLRFAIRERDARFIFTIPTVFLVEHSCYVIGFWKQMIRPRRVPRVANEP
jgi:glycosyltransferase involved in cell wall biosynthesis